MIEKRKNPTTGLIEYRYVEMVDTPIPDSLVMESKSSQHNMGMDRPQNLATS